MKWGFDQLKRGAVFTLIMATSVAPVRAQQHLDSNSANTEVAETAWLVVDDKTPHRSLDLSLNDDGTSSPYRLNLKNDLVITGTGLALLALAAALDSHAPLDAQTVDQLDRKNINALDRSLMAPYNEHLSNVSDGLLTLNLLLPLSVVVLLGDDNNDQWAEVSVMYLETLLATGALVSLTKSLSSRKRPLAYDKSAPLSVRTAPDTQRSFFSGHTAHAFSATVFLNTVAEQYYPNSKWLVAIRTGSYSLTALVAGLRMASGKHFATDVAVGAAIGSVVGYYVPKLHLSERTSLGVDSLEDAAVITLRVKYN